MKVTVTQTGDFKERLADLSRRANELHGQQNIPLSELMPPEFVSAHSELSSLQELLDASPFTIASVEDFKAIPDDAWDSFIKEKTSFSTWREMQEAAVREWTRKKLGFNT